MKSSHSTQFNLYKVVDDTYRIDFEQVCHFGLPTSARIRGNLTVHSSSKAWPIRHDGIVTIYHTKKSFFY